MSGSSFNTFNEYKRNEPDNEHIVHFGNDWGLFVDFEDIEHKKHVTFMTDINIDSGTQMDDTSLHPDASGCAICRRSCFTITASFILTYLIFYII